jgi:hypothetical protein
MPKLTIEPAKYYANAPSQMQAKTKCLQKSGWVVKLPAEKLTQLSCIYVTPFRDMRPNAANEGY